MLDEFEGEGTACSFVSVDGRGQENEVRADEVSNEREGDCCCFVNDDKLGLTEDMCVFWLDIL